MKLYINLLRGLDNMNQSFRRGMSKAVSTMLVAAMTLGISPKVASSNEEGSIKDLLNMPLSKETKDSILKEVSPYLKEAENSYKDTRDKNELVRVIVELEGKSAAEMVMRGTKPGNAEVSKVENSQKSAKLEAKNLEGASIRHSYTNVINGFSMDVKRGEIDKLRDIEGVKSVIESDKHEISMNSAKTLTQVENIWKNYSLKGNGMVVAILDTGIDYNHKDFRTPDNKEKLKLNKDSVDKVKATGILKADKVADTYFSEKIPFGYNYADKNNDVIDKRDSKSPHGAHVAGIVGADGKEEEVKENKAIKGVAPEVQLLAMKIFSNGPLGKYTYADDQIAAIDDSVALGADVINMSLGSPAGFRKDDDPTQKAIERATDAGVMVVVSAGNSGYSTSPFDNLKLNDVGVVGSPALAKDALMVASYENSKAMANNIKVKDSKGDILVEGAYSPHQYSMAEVINKGNEILDFNLGRVDDFNGKDAKGKIALIKRGDIGFTDKILNAQKNGAVGVIVYNKDKDEGLINMATDPNIKIPAIFIPNSIGESIYQRLASEKVLFNGDIGMKPMDNSLKDDYSDFSSWGPAPSLDFKPQISGPGGRIYSTLNNNEYGNMNGTSMSAPHVSGTSALLLQGIKEYAPELSGREKIDYAKNILMNTSSVRIDKYGEDVPYSPRRQGAGLVQIEDAVKNRVTATYNGAASVALKEIKGNKAKFTIDLKNHGDKEVKYSLGVLGGVLTQSEEASPNKMVHDIILDEKDASVEFNKETVTLAPKGSEKVDVTLNIGKELGSEKFLEGYVTFKSDDTNIPSLNVPFMGFYGDWSKESITSNNAWDKEKHPLIKALLENGDYSKVSVENLMLSYNGEGESRGLNILGVTSTNKDKTKNYDKNKIAISPNKDNYNDSLVPAIYLMRNAKSIEVDVLNENKEVIRRVGNVDEVKKKIYEAPDEAGKVPQIIEKIGWDGQVYNKNTGKMEVVKDGQYFYRLKLKVDIENAKEQVIEVPVKIDTESPKVNILRYDNIGEDSVKIYFKAEDGLSGINENGLFPVVVNGVLNVEATKEKSEYIKEENVYTKVIKGLKANSINEIQIGAFDYANNLGGAKAILKVGQVPPAVIKFDDKDFKEGYIKVKTSEYKIKGNISRYIKSLTVNGKEVELSKLNDKGEVYFETIIKPEEGLNTVDIKAVDYDGQEIMNCVYKIYKDTVKPLIELEKKIGSKEEIVVNGNNLNIKGKVSDNTFGYSFYVNGELYKKVSNSTPVGNNGNEYNFKLKFKDIKDGQIITLKAVDDFENSEEVKLKVVKK